MKHKFAFALCRWFAKKTSVVTVSGLVDALLQVTMLSPVLKALSEGVLVAGIKR